MTLPVEILVSQFSTNLMSSTFLTNTSGGFNTAATADLALTVSEMEALFVIGSSGAAFSPAASRLLDNYCRKQLVGATGFTVGSSGYYGYTGTFPISGATGEGFTNSDIMSYPTMCGPTGSLMNGFLITSSTTAFTAPNTGNVSDARYNSGYTLQNVMEDEMMYTSKAMFTDPLIQTTFCSSDNRNVVASDLYALGVHAKNRINTIISDDIASATSPIANNIFETVRLNRNVISTSSVGFIVGDALTWNVVVTPSQAQTQIMASAAGVSTRTYTFRLYCSSDSPNPLNAHKPVKDKFSSNIYSQLTYYGILGPTGNATGRIYTDQGITGYTSTGYGGPNGVTALGARYTKDF